MKSSVPQDPLAGIVNGSFEMLVSATTVAKSCMIVCHGATPKQAAFGITPSLLTEFEAFGTAVLHDGKRDSAGSSGQPRDVNRLREIPLEMMVSGIAPDGMTGAMNANARPAGHYWSRFKPRDQADTYRKRQ